MGSKLSKTGGLYEPLNNYVVDVINREGETVSLKTLAHTAYHAREKIYAKFCHLQDDLTKYSMGVSALLHQGSINGN
jgi:hypothetical protein